MSWATAELVGVLTFLLPGFVGAAVFYALTSHPRPGEFDRVVQALVFTTVAQALTWAARWLAGWYWPAYEWPAGLELLVSAVAAVAVALLAVYFANHDTIHSVLRRIGITRETSYPSEWYSAFAEYPGRYVVLYLKDQRCVYGWLEEWPGSPDRGYFRVSEAVWIIAGRQIPATGIIATLIPASAVEMVEFLTD